MSRDQLSRRDIQIWHAFKKMGQAVLTEIERDLLEATELSGSDFGVLSRLVDLGDGELRQQVLADSMGWHKSRLSHQLTRMQDRGLVRRSEPGPRVILVTLTEAGRRKIRAARPIHAASVHKRLLDRLSKQESDLLIAICQKLTSSKKDAP